MSVIGSLNLHAALPLVEGKPATATVTTARQSLHAPVLPPSGQRQSAPPFPPRSGARNERRTSPLKKP